jgi:hypothetical protein
MIRCGITRIGFIIIATMLSAHSIALSQNESAPRTPSGEDLLVMRFAPGKWFHEVQGDVRSIETVEIASARKNNKWAENRSSPKIVYFDRRGFATEAIEGEEGRTVWKYDAQGRVSEMSLSLGGEPLAREVYHYNLAQRKVTVDTYYFGSDKPRFRETAIFDERWNERRKETEYFDEPGGNSQPRKEVVVYNLTYDAKGRQIASTIGNEKGAISHRFTTEYASDSNRLVKTTGYQYDAGSGALLSKYVSLYDKAGYQAAYMYYDPRGRLLRRETYTREFDARGNWITETRVMWANDQGGAPSSSTFIKRRKITFY